MQSDMIQIIHEAAHSDAGNVHDLTDVVTVSAKMHPDNSQPMSWKSTQMGPCQISGL